MASFSSEQNTQPSPQLLSVGEKDRKRLLEVYVTRSLSLNDGSQCPRRQEQRSHKWVTIAERKKRDRKHSSDTSLNLSVQNFVADEDVVQEAFAASEPDKKVETLPEKKFKKWKIKGSLRRNDGSNASQKSNSKPKKWYQSDKVKEDENDVLTLSTNTAGDAQTKRSDELEHSLEERKTKDGKKSKKPTVWKSFLNWFSKGNQEKEQDPPTAEESRPVSQLLTPQISCLPLPETLSRSDSGLRRSKNMKKKQSSRRSAKWRRSGDMSTGKPIEVEATDCYYEKVSEELEKIVHEVKDGPADGNAALQPTGQNGVKKDYEDVIKRITELIKQEGDSMDNKLKDNMVVNSFLEGISYRSFQQMADQYVQSEVPDKKTQRPVAAPELVKFAFTLDFTARVANLHRQATGQVMGFGNQYLQDRFTHMSESHPHLNDTKTENFDQDYSSI
ncbi:uncharacterized protein LOC130424861 isoform X1 [Triplophysa dalaica]|uniref:uncharacterized protein LOC130424861 isoform X1 n=1 Tax=Triplophysa dalaica TaxID=1582913 RepID=UPI0024DF9731|nr:uncharacterized protein LOC130424861 isoform X1 [Triplophysa dalaica]